MFSCSLFVLAALATEITALELAPTDQTSFTYPEDGTGVALPFPPEIASLTGESDWPELWVTPPFTPNMAKLYDPSSTTILSDITVPPNANGDFPPRLST